MHAKAVLSLALAGLALAAPQAGPQGPRPTPDANWNWGGEHHNKTITTTKTLTAYTTYCPGPTTLLFNGKKYTVTKETTLTITDCPCTVVETHAPTHRPHHPTTGGPLPPPKTTGSASPPPQTGSAPPPSQPTANPPVNNNNSNSPPSTPNTPNTPNSPNPPVKVSGAERSNAKFGLAVAAGAAIAGLMAL